MSADLHQLREDVSEIREIVIRLEAALGERCPDHDRRLTSLEAKRRNGGGGANGWRDPKFWGILAVALAALATAIAAIAGVR